MTLSDSAATIGAPIQFVLDGRQVEVVDAGYSLLEALRDVLGERSPKDGCSPQGQCGCCTVLVDGAARAACVTPLRRIAGREVTTLTGLVEADRHAWGEALWCTGASQCGFCTPGIVMRLESLLRKDPDASAAEVERALAAHLCRCTGWRTILDAFEVRKGDGAVGSVGQRTLDAASARATMEGRATQLVSPQVALGDGGFADDRAPLGALVAVPDGAGGWAVGETLHRARLAAGKIQGRRSTEPAALPVAIPDGAWDVTLQTSWVDPAALEIDASWCVPGGEPASPLANGGAFGAKMASPVMQVARRLADEHGRAVRVLLSREDTVRSGSKRPPLAAGIDRTTGLVSVRVARTDGIVEALRLGFGDGPGTLEIVEVDVVGPPTTCDARAAGWAEGVALRAALDGCGPEFVVDPVTGGRAQVSVGPDGSIDVEVDGGDPLDGVVLRSYCIGAVHMAAGLVCSEGLTVSAEGQVLDLTVRSFGVLRAMDMVPVTVQITPSAAPPVAVSDAVFAAVAAVLWAQQGFPPSWPTGAMLR